MGGMAGRVLDEVGDGRVVGVCKDMEIKEKVEEGKEEVENT